MKKIELNVGTGMIIILVISLIYGALKYSELRNHYENIIKEERKFSANLSQAYMSAFLENLKLRAKNKLLLEQQGNSLIIPPEDDTSGGDELREDDIPPEENEIEDGIPLIISDNKVGIIDI